MQRLFCATLALCAAVPGQSPFASRVVSFDDMGQAGGGVFAPSNTLGAPDGTVHSLGIGGNVVLGFDVVIADGPGADLIVSENPFVSTSNPALTFAEMLFVEVSSDGTSFARIPNRYDGPAVSPGPFAFVNAGAYEGMAGAGATNPSAVDLRDVVEAGGDAIDLADLAGHPLVTSGVVDLAAITQVRLVDVRDGVDQDSRGVTIYDPGSGSADIDGVTVVHDAASAVAPGPIVDVTIPADGAFELSFDDPDGWRDLDPASLQVALYGTPVGLVALLPLMNISRFDATGFTLKLRGVLPAGFLLRVSASAKDLSGHRSGDVRSRPTP
ncbi:MAG: hypothetical protein AAF628_25125 [Planctomycetota bacterium]